MSADAGETGSVLPKKSLEERLADEARFLKTWLENPLGMGAVSPSGRFLARAMARYVDPDVPGPVIELGPGTGPVTEALIDRGIAPERLVLVEFDAQFCRLLRERFPTATVVRGDAYRLAATLEGLIERAPSAIVSSLPLLTRPDRQRLNLLAQAFELLRPGAPFIQFTYGVLSPIPRRGGGGADFHAEASAPVWLNLPPARVWVYRPTGARTEQADEPSRFRLDLRSGKQLLNDEWRECGEGILPGLRRRAEQARVAFEVRAERLRTGLLPRSEDGLRQTRPGRAFDLMPARARCRQSR